MKRFAALFERLDRGVGTSEKVAALVAYFREAVGDAKREADAAWAVAIFTGRKVRRAVSSTQMKRWASEVSGLPEWLISESHAAVGDFGETLALILPDRAASEQAASATERSLSEIYTGLILPMSRGTEAQKRELMIEAWTWFGRRERLVLHKLMSGTFRVGVSRGMVVKALAQVAGIDQARMDQRLMGDWPITAESFRALMRSGSEPTSDARSESDAASGLNPWPFFLAHQVPDELDRADLMEEQFGPASRWLAEWKWDGLRGQLLRRREGRAIWSRGEELISGAFPELMDAALALPVGTTLDGEVLGFENGAPLDFSHLQTRMMRKQTSGLLFADVPVVFMAYDVLEHGGQDVRGLPLRERRALLERIVAAAGERLLITSPVVQGRTWAELEALRATSRARGVEGLMLKRLDSAYGTGRTKLTSVSDRATAGWWKWKVDPYVIDCVLVGAQRGSGRRASLFTDYTFALWSGDERGRGELVPFAKAYHGKGMTDEVFVRIDAFVRENTIGRVAGAGIRMVRPSLVFELAFEGIQESRRHKSGLAVRFPRISKWRTDKTPEEGDTLATLRQMLRAHERRSMTPGDASDAPASRP